MFRNLCRLCLGTDELLWIFDKRMADNMMEIIHVTSGVEITKTDSITQMVCSTCCQITIKMFKFRTTSIKNDKELKARCAGYNIAQLTNNSLACKMEAVKPAVTETPEKSPVAPPKPPFQMPVRYRLAHPSVRQVVRKNPTIQLPEECLKSHVGAYITLLTDEVDEWFKEKNLTDAEIAELKREAYEYATRPVAKSAPKAKKRKIELRDDWSEEKKWKRIKSFQNIAKIPKIEVESSDNPLKMKITTKSETTDPAPDSSVAPTVHKSVRVLRENVRAIRDSCVSPTPHGHNTRRRSSANSDNSVKPVDADSSSSAVKPVEASTEANSGDNGLIETIIRSELKVLKVDTVQTPSGPILSSLLKDDSGRKKPDREVITLRSLLQGTDVGRGKVSRSNEDIIDVDPDDPPPVSSTSAPSATKPGKEQKDGLPRHLVVPEVEFELFTSRPFLDKPESDMLVVSDDDDRGADNYNDNSSDFDPLVIDMDSPSCSNFSSTSGEKTDKTTFAESLNLMPKTSDSTNMPDLSLVSLASKSHKLYTCKVCDSQHTSLKDLKYHERRTHTKCPFCNKRFRSLSNRDEHVKFFCAINSSPLELKTVILDLVRIDEVQAIREKYPAAFEPRSEETSDVEIDVLNSNEQEVPKVPEQVTRVELAAPPVEPKVAKVEPKVVKVEQKVVKVEQRVAKVEQKTAKVDQKGAKATKTGPHSVINSVVECDPATRIAVSELEKFLNYAEIVPVKGGPAKVDKPATTKKKAAPPRISQDVICISDEESEVSKPEPQPEPQAETSTENPSGQIKVVNSDILKNINIHDNDVNVLKRILSQAKLKTDSTLVTLKNSPIVDGSSTRVKIFKNLRRHLYHYKIPIDVKFNQSIAVEYKPSKAPSAKSLSDLWYTMTPKELKPLTVPQEVQPIIPAAPTTPTTTQTPTCSVATTKVSIPRLNPPQRTISLTFQPSITSTVNPAPGSSNQPSLSIPTTFQAVLPPSTVNQAQISLTPTSYQSVVATATGQTSVPTFTFTSMPSSVSTANILFTTRSPLTTTASNATSTPLVLNGAQSLGATSGATNFTNIILVPSTLLQKEVTLPAVQGPLPVIHSVSSAVDMPTSTDDAVAKLASITNALMPASQTNPSSVVPQQVNFTLVDKPLQTPQPAIRVKNLKELS